MIDFKMTDLDGRWRHLTIPVQRFTEKIMKQGTGFDGSNYGYAAVEKSDMVFVPDLATGHLEPFLEIPTLSMIGDVFLTGDTTEPFDQYPRSVANRAEEYMKSMGIADEMRIAPEFEFYVFDHVDYDVQQNHAGYMIDVEQANWNSGNKEHNLGYKVPIAGGYHSTPPMDVFFQLRNEICLLLEERGVKVKYHHHEVGGPGQLEIETESGLMREMADKAMLIK